MGREENKNGAVILPFKREPKGHQKTGNTPKNDSAKVDGETMRLLRIADEIDAIILKHLNAGEIAPRDLAGVISHRLGTLMRHLEGKEQILDICQKVITRQAAVDE